jgi:hypothetical protein
VKNILRWFLHVFFVADLQLGIFIFGAVADSLQQVKDDYFHSTLQSLANVFNCVQNNKISGGKDLMRCIL